jgi:hypothetical protein
MKYMLLIYGSQKDYDGLAGKPGATSEWSPADFESLRAFMTDFNEEFDQLRRARRHARADRSSACAADPAAERRARGNGRSVRRNTGGSWPASGSWSARASTARHSSRRVSRRARARPVAARRPWSTCDPSLNPPPSSSSDRLRRG